MTRFQPPRGTTDFLPEEMSRRQYMLDVIRRVFESFGFEPLDTPAFESWELLSKKGGGGDAIKDEIYYFRDKSDRELGLRFDLTVPLARVIANNPNLLKPFKRYQAGKVWRYDRPQAGRMREFVQMDADIVGSEKMDADAECIAAAAEALRRLGFRHFEVRLNARKILNGLVEFADIPEKKASAVFRILDKLEKKPRSEILADLKKAGIGASRVNRLMKAIGERGRPSKMLESMKRMLDGITKAEEGLKELEEITALAKPYGFEDNLVIDFSLVRGLDYYTGPIFEITVKAGKNVGSVAGGGRYDKLISLYEGNDTPSTGISLGIERIYEIMKSEKMFDSQKQRERVFVVSVNDDVKMKAVEIAHQLRSAGIAAESELTGRDIRKQMDYANRKGVPHVIVIGPKEVKSGKYTLKDMKTGKEASLTFEALVKKLK